jgi:hypothetical protein
MSQLNKLVFPIPESLKNQYDSDHRNNGLFDGNNLVLPIRAEDYQYTKTYLKPTAIVGISSSFVRIENAPFEIQATVLDQRESIIYILQYLKEQAVSNIYNYSLITMYDYCKLDTATGVSNGYETRLGLLDYEILGGTFRTGNAPTSYRYGKGVRVLFNGV